MKDFYIISGPKYCVVAKNEAEAYAKYRAMLNNEDCPCGHDECHCVELIEEDTWIEGVQ